MIINALEIADKKIDEVKMVICGAGAAAISCGKIYKALGVKAENIIMFDSKGPLNEKRDNLTSEKKDFISSRNDVESLSDAVKNSDIFIVPKDNYFFLGDNRDCSKDSRYLSSVGYVHKDNLVGKAQFIFFSSDRSFGSIFYFWKWNQSIRFDRFFKKIR